MRIILFSMLISLISEVMTSQLSAASVPNSPPCPCPKAFEGFHLGGNIGYGDGGGKNNNVFLTGGLTSTLQNNRRLTGLDGGINAGYTHRFNNWGVGLEFVANWTNVKGTNTANAVGLVIAQDQIRLKNSLQVRANLSYIICNFVAPKIILGWDNSKWQRNFHATAIGFNFQANPQKRHNGFLWGLGVDFLIVKNFVAGIEYTRVISGNQKITVTNPLGGGTSATTSFKPHYNKIAFVAKYIF